MDSLTQACLGGAIGGAVLGRRLGRRAVVLGAVTATLPDLDSFIDYGNAVADYTFHRGFSHSLFVLTGVAALATLICSRLPRARDIPARRWWWFWWLCLITHPLLDACTTYGTQLMWPLAPPPTAWPLFFIIDPLYTLPLLIAVIVMLIRGRPGRAPLAGLALSTLYLGFAISAKAAVIDHITPTLIERDLVDRPVMVQPTPFNTLVWRVTVIDDGRQLEALVSLFDGDQAPRFDLFRRPQVDYDSAVDLWAGQRLAWFSAPFWRISAADDQLLITDLRMGFPGSYFFAFVVAEREDNGWQAVTPRQPQDLRPDMSLLPRLAARIVDSRALCPADFGDRDLLLPESECVMPST
ncbi:metal-dependent hydrolase [Kushneria aurantia]|uniref:Metal-dependent hydrolase n=1 Tax=Kushneria aurantia TaxID=504092 RepID=A0ABV6G1C0_9GAMM|nr:metal-dependent hydrolase [Kushneria aurantia]